MRIHVRAHTLCTQGGYSPGRSARALALAARVAQHKSSCEGIFVQIQSSESEGDDKDVLALAPPKWRRKVFLVARIDNAAAADAATAAWQGMHGCSFQRGASSGNASIHDQLLTESPVEKEDGGRTELREAFEQADEQGSGNIDFDKFVEMRCNAGKSRSKLRKTFEELDADGSGTIDLLEFSAYRDKLEEQVRDRGVVAFVVCCCVFVCTCMMCLCVRVRVRAQGGVCDPTRTASDARARTHTHTKGARAAGADARRDEADAPGAALLGRGSRWRAQAPFSAFGKHPHPCPASTHVSICLVCLSFCLSVCVPARISVSASVCPSVGLSSFCVCLSVLSVCLPVGRSV